MVAVDPADGPSIELGPTSADGNTTMRLPSDGATYTISGSAVGYEQTTLSVNPNEAGRLTEPMVLTGDASVEVTVTDELFGEAVENATVRLIGDDGAYSGRGDGTITIDSVPSQVRYPLHVDAPGYRSHRDTYLVKDPGTADHAIELAGDTNVLITVVGGADGHAIADATIQVERSHGHTNVRPLQTNEAGQIEIQLAEHAPVTVGATADGYRANETVISSVRAGDQIAVTIRLAEDDGLPGFGIPVVVIAIAIAILLDRGRKA